MRNLRSFLDRIILSICVFVFMFMTVLGTYQVLTRYLLKSPSTVSEELISYSFAWMSMFAASYIFGKKDHMRMVFLIERFSKKVQQKIAILSEFVILLFAVGVLISGGLYITTLTMTQTSPSLGISMGFVYMVIPVCGIITAIYSILNISDLIKNSKEV